MNRKIVFINDLPDDHILVGDVAIDTEAMGLNLDRDRLCCVQICDQSLSTYIVHFPDGECDYSKAKNLKNILLDKKIQKIFHYARFDVSILRKYLKIDEIPNIYCTKIVSRLVRTYSDRHGLRTIVGEICGVDLSKEQQSSNWGREFLSNKQIDYAKNDIIYLHKIRDEFNKMLKNNNRTELAKNYFEFINTICTSDMLGFSEDLFRHQ
jgi:ribonuclease D